MLYFAVSCILCGSIAGMGRISCLTAKPRHSPHSLPSLNPVFRFYEGFTKFSFTISCPRDYQLLIKYDRAREREPPIPNPCTRIKLTDETKGADGHGHNWCANDDEDNL